MTEGKRVGLLVLILGAVVAVAGGVVLTLLYRTAIAEERARLQELAQSQARLIEAIAQQESASLPQIDDRAVAAVLEQLRTAHASYRPPTATGEITIATMQRGSIVFLLRHHKHGTMAPTTLPSSTPFAEPMRLALSGRSGTIQALDYRGQEVLAAHEPVKGLGWGVVAKVDMTEIRWPFIRAGLWGGLCSLAAVAIGAAAFVRVTSPLLRHLQSSEEQLRRAVVDAPFPVMIYAEDGRIVLTSKVWNELSGYSPDQIPTTADWALRAYGLRHHTEKAEMDELFSLAGRTDHGEREIHTAGGRLRTWAFSSASLGRGEKGQRLAISMAMDVTERKLAQEALRAQKEQLDVTLRSIGDAVITTDVDGRVVMMNKVAETLTGWPLGEASGRPLTHVFHIVHQHTRQICENPVEKVLQTGGIIGLANHTALISRDGTERIIADSGAPIVDQEGRIFGVVLVFRDNTEIDRVHEALRDSERFAQSTIDALSSHVCVLDEKGVILHVNSAWRQFAAGPSATAARQQIEGTNYLDICDSAQGDGAAEAAAFAAGIRDVMADKTEQFSLEYPCHTPQRKYWFIGRVTRFRGPGPRRVVVAHEDITAPKLAEQAVAAAKEAAEQANQAKDRFLATLSHELRTPLTPVLATLSVLQDDLRVPASLSDEVAMMRHNIELEARLIDDLLDLTRITRGRLHMQLQTVDAHELVNRALIIARQSLDTHAVTIQLDLGAAHARVHADPARLQQVFWNIIKNAMQYSTDGGRLVIRSRTTPQGQWEIQFIDSGIGIAPDFLPRIFDPFQQEDTAPLRRPGGLGLGLAIARSIMLQLGGTIHAASEGRGKGSTFTISLPAEAAAQSGQSHALAPGSQAARWRILLVEDHVSTLKVLARLLRAGGHDVTTAACVQEAVAAAGAGTFDLLLSDIGLPDGSGLDIMRWFATSKPIRGIAFSGYGMDSDIQASREAGFTAHLVKPVVAQRLIQAIQDVMQKKDA